MCGLRAGFTAGTCTAPAAATATRRTAAGGAAVRRGRLARRRVPLGAQPPELLPQVRH